MRTPEPQAPPPHLAGSLLLAHPGLRDPNFMRSVVLMSVHGEEGAMGVVLNRPTGKYLGDINGSFAYGPLARVPVFTGGPVQCEQLIFVAWQKQAEGFRLQFGVEPEAALVLATDDCTLLRAYLGYSGWEAGQLEGELRQHAWLVAPMEPDLLDSRLDQNLWRALLGRQGPEWKLLANEPVNPGFN